MANAEVTVHLDKVLRPLGFRSSRTSWNRHTGPFVQVIDLQPSKSGDLLTLNAGVLDVPSHELVFGEPVPKVVIEPRCTVRVRIGNLLNGRDLWWRVDDAATPNAVVEVVQSHVLPFLQRMRSPEDMAEFLTMMGVLRKRHTLPIIQLAVLKSRLGERAEACRLLAQVCSTAVGAWSARAAEVAERLKC